MTSEARPYYVTVLERLADDSVSRSLQECPEILAEVDAKALIDSCLHEPTDQALAAMAAQSYQHANGFDKISFPRLGMTTVQLRLHIWPGTGDAVREPDAHNHRWSFASRVLCGTLANNTYRITHERAGDYVHYVQTPYTPDAGSTFAFSGRAGLSQVDTIQVAEGGGYSLPAEAIHRIVVPDGCYTATLALELTPTRNTADVYTAGTKPTDLVVDSRRFTPTEVRERLGRLHDKL